MTSKQFVYQGREWEAIYDGIGVGVAAGFEPQVDTFSFTFKCLTDPGQPIVRGHLRDANPHSLSDEQLAGALKKALDKAREQS